MTDADIIARCIRHCANRRDWRGRWRMERAACAALGTAQIAKATAHAAASFGAWLHDRAAFFSSPPIPNDQASPRRSVSPSEPARLCDLEHRGAA